jgi:spectinomycin phosphotransferase/16S rRNA (guanine(1405)-N(7))-methyltransferase
MLAPPADLTDEIVIDALARGWALTTARLAYRAVGWGSHHWRIADDAGTAWFVTVDDLRGRRDFREPTVDPAYDRLRASLASAVALRDEGRAFVVAPIPTLDDQPLVRARDFAVSLYPFVEGESFGWGEFASAEHLRAVLEMLVQVHKAPMAARRHACIDSFTIPHRASLEATLARPGAAPDCGPYARPTADLINRNRAALKNTLDRYDELVALAGTSRTVLTHGEPHPGNTMLTADGWRLIDWDTVLVAPPERDLWDLEPLHSAYTEATGVDLVPAVLELYRIRWTLADIASDVSRFRRVHTAGVDEVKSWELLQANVESLQADTDVLL